MLKRLFKKQIKKEHESYRYKVLNQEQVVFHVKQNLFDKAEKLEATEWLLHQHIALKMLVEQELAEQIPNGFIVQSENVSCFDADTITLLELPQYFAGHLTTDIRGEVRRSNFHINIKVHIDGIDTLNWKLEGPFLRLSATKKYTLPHYLYKAFVAHYNHEQEEKGEFNNLNFVASLQQAKKAGAAINLAHFDKLEIIKPQSMGVQGVTDSDGNLRLSPNLGSEITPEDYHARKGQISKGQSTALRSKDKIVLLSEKTLEAVHEIIKNDVIPKNQVKAFFDCPSAFLNASLVDLDLGFSVRVKGATKFKHAYFGKQSESKIDWYGGFSESKLSNFPAVIAAIKSYEDLDYLRQTVNDIRATNSDILTFEGNDYLISSDEEVEETFEKASAKLAKQAQEKDELQKKVTAVVDIDLNDEDVTLDSPRLEGAIKDVLFKEPLDWNNYKFAPFPHQETGVRWLLGIKNHEINGQKVTGALLADDMGLGKTFMGLSAIAQHYRICKNAREICKPALVVAPLSLLENWQEEVEKFFKQSPFYDIVILQSSADLIHFRLKGAGQETKIQQFDADESLDDSHIKYALKFGKNYGHERLDMPRRLVITTYQALRDYQFSMCKIDWSFVIFDEAQNTKNPNTLQTRAAKGLKAEFKVMATGTPVENSLCDFWCLMDTAMPGYLGSHQEFKARYISNTNDDDEKARLGRLLRLNVGALMLRRLKEDNLKNLPDKTMYVGIEGDTWQYAPYLAKPLYGKQLDAYNCAIASMNDDDNSGASKALTVLHQLKNISLHHDLQHKERFEVPLNNSALVQHMRESGKLESMIATLEAIKNKDEKVIIFAINKRLQSYLSVALGKLFRLGVVPVINGDTKAIATQKGTKTRRGLIAQFESKAGFNIIIMSPVAAGTGLTVIGANHVIHLERHWNPAKEAQATDRVYRIGQTKDVHVYIPILHHPEKTSFDINLHHLLNNKTLLKDAVVTPENVSMKASDWGLQ